MFVCVCVYEGQPMEGILITLLYTQSLFMNRSVICCAWLLLMAATSLEGSLAEPCPAGQALEGSYYSRTYPKSLFQKTNMRYALLTEFPSLSEFQTMPAFPLPNFARPSVICMNAFDNHLLYTCTHTHTCARAQFPCLFVAPVPRAGK